MKIITKAKTATPKHKNVAREISKKKPVKKTNGKTLKRAKHGMMQKSPEWKPFGM